MGGDGKPPSGDGVTQSGAPARVISVVGGRDITAYRKQPLTESGQLRQAVMATIRLGTVDSTQPVDVQDVAFRGDTAYVLDAETRRLSAYNRAGTRLWSAGGRDANDGRLVRPHRLTLAGDTLYVTDLGAVNRINLFDLGGRFARGFDVDSEKDVLSLAVAGERLFVTIPSPEPDDTTLSVVLMMDRDGKLLGRGCTQHPTVTTSISRRGVLGAYRFSYVWSSGGRVYCQQGVTPVIQVLDGAGRLAGTVDRAPEFFVDPRDEPETTNPRRMMAHSATWLAPTRFLPSAHGFVWSFIAYDTVTQRSSFRLFACDSATGPAQCAVGETPDRPLQLIGADTLLLLREDPNPESVPTLILVRLTGTIR